MDTPYLAVVSLQVRTLPSNLFYGLSKPFHQKPDLSKCGRVGKGYEIEERVRRTALALTFGVCLLGALRSEAASLSGTVSFDEKPVEGAIVYLESVQPQLSPPRREPVVVEQRNLTFSPEVIPVVQGTTVKFVNSDNVYHGLFSPSPGVEKFNLGTYGHGEQRLMKFDTPGEVVILCNIHLEMEARVVVLKDPYFAVTTADGRYLVHDVPPGAYLLRVWRKHEQALAEPVELSLANDLALDLRLKQ